MKIYKQVITKEQLLDCKVISSIPTSYIITCEIHRFVYLVENYVNYCLENDCDLLTTCPLCIAELVSKIDSMVSYFSENEKTNQLTVN